jgi:hypothetical protein
MGRKKSDKMALYIFFFFTKEKKMFGKKPIKKIYISIIREKYLIHCSRYALDPRSLSSIPAPCPVEKRQWISPMLLTIAWMAFFFLFLFL